MFKLFNRWNARRYNRVRSFGVRRLWEYIYTEGYPSSTYEYNYDIFMEVYDKFFLPLSMRRVGQILADEADNIREMPKSYKDLKLMADEA